MAPACILCWLSGMGPRKNVAAIGLQTASTSCFKAFAQTGMTYGHCPSVGTGLEMLSQCK